MPNHKIPIVERDGIIGKVCSRCKEWQPLDAYSPHARGAAGRQARCRPCVYASARERWAANPDIRERREAYRKAYYKANEHKYFNTRRRYKLKKYGLTLEEYEALLALQDGKCAICGSSDPSRSGWASMPVDHDHETGQVRGLLCDDCNNGIGRFKDDPELLRKAIVYLGGDLT